MVRRHAAMAGIVLAVESKMFNRYLEAMRGLMGDV